MLNSIASKSRTIMQFFAAQGITMAGNLLFGLLCVRLLPPAEYAKFVVVFAVQCTLVILMDANFSGTLIPLIGERIDDLTLIADYVASLRQLAVRAYLLVGVIAIFCFPLMVKNRHWSQGTVVAMIVIMLISTWFQRISTIYGAVIIMQRRRNTWYTAQMISSLGTLALLGVFQFFHRVGPFTAILLNVGGIVFVAGFYFFHARKLLGQKGESSPEKKRAVLRLALPNVPQSVFYALQGQIPLFLITYLGRTTGVASVGALARLGQIFALLQQANSLLVEPYFAKLNKERFKTAYPTALVLISAVCVLIMVVADLTPGTLLWFLGPQYKGLTYEVKLVVASGAIGTLSAALWGIHASRRFVYWWNVSLSIGLTFLAQFLFVWKADMSTVRGVLWMNIATNLVSLFVNALSGVWGLIKGPREAELPALVAVPESSMEAESSIDYALAEGGLPQAHVEPRLAQLE